MHNLLLPCLFASSLVAQSSWVLQPTTVQPPARSGHGLDYHAGSVSAYLGNSIQPDLWRWNGVAWTNLSIASPTSLPGGFLWNPFYPSTCYDGAGNLMVFGGYRWNFFSHSFALIDETWLLPTSGGAWVQANVAVRPPARINAKMVLTNQGVVLFGGSTIGGWGSFNDTWRWTGTWTNVSPPTAPPARHSHSLAFDSLRNVVVLFGGAAPSTGTQFNDTWEFNGTTWLLRSTPQSPPARQDASMAFAAHPGRTVLFGGWSLGGGSSTDTWVWDGSTWQIVPTTPAAPWRQSAGMTYDAARQKVFLFGGQGSGVGSECYYLDLQLPVLTAASYTPFGTGCPSPAGPVPTMAAAANELPRPGTTSHLVVGNLPNGALTLPVFVLGMSNTFEPSSSHPLPFDLGLLGWPGCQQLVSHDVMVAAPTVTGQASYALAVPLTSSLYGFTFHAQAFVVYVPTGVAVSNALTGVVGY